MDLNHDLNRFKLMI